jgi:uncharacterized protein YjbJ (UPF0337 family)
MHSGVSDTPFAAHRTKGFRAGFQNSNRSTGDNIMRPGIKDVFEGKVREVKGKVKEKAGQLTNNPDMEAEGTVEKIAGKVQKKIGQVERAVDKW